jgi:hypothetical protein
LSGRILAGFLAVLLILAMPGAAEPTRVVQAVEILKKIELGQPVEYDNVTIVGDLDLSGLNLPKVPVERTEDEKYWDLPDYGLVVSSPIVITNSVIKGSVDLRYCLSESRYHSEHHIWSGCKSVGFKVQADC